MKKPSASLSGELNGKKAALQTPRLLDDQGPRFSKQPKKKHVWRLNVNHHGVVPKSWTATKSNNCRSLMLFGIFSSSYPGKQRESTAERPLGAAPPKAESARHLRDPEKGEGVKNDFACNLQQFLANSLHPTNPRKLARFFGVYYNQYSIFLMRTAIVLKWNPRRNNKFLRASWCFNAIVRLLFVPWKTIDFTGERLRPFSFVWLAKFIWH